MINERKTWNKNCTLFESQCISTKVLVGTLFLTPSTGEPFSGQSQYLHCSVTLRPRVLVWPRESNPRPPTLQSGTVPTELILLPLYKKKVNEASIEEKSMNQYLSIKVNFITGTFVCTCV